MKRNLDGVYFRIKRDKRWDNICFSDLTDEEMNQMMENRTEEWLKSLYKILGETMRDIINTFDLENIEKYTEAQLENDLYGKDILQLKELCIQLGKNIHQVGDSLDIVCE